jgi:hypothetical protein
VIPLPADGSLPSEDSATLLPVSGSAQTGGPNLNGIVAKSGVLLVGETSSGKLFDPETGIADAVDLGGQALPGPDGLELRGEHALRGRRRPGDGGPARSSPGQRCGARRNNRSGP